MSDWQRVDPGPYLRGEIRPAEPTHLRRQDGVALLYPKKLHWISGEPESGKSWLIMIAVVELLLEGADVLYLDFETDPLDFFGRLLSLGATAEAIEEHTRYFRPETPMEDTACEAVIADAIGCKLAALDGVNAAMSTSDFDPNSAKDFYQWWAALGAPIQTAVDGPTACLDHVIKDATNRGAYASGTGQKLAAVDVHLGVEKIKPFGRGVTGSSRVVVHKDRPGALRRHADGKTIATLRLASDPDTEQMAASIEVPVSSRDDDTGEFRPTILMERVSRYLEEQDERVSKNNITTNVRGDDKTLRDAADRLVVEGFAGSERTGTGKTSSIVYWSIRPFRTSDTASVKHRWTSVGTEGNDDFGASVPPSTGHRSNGSQSTPEPNTTSVHGSNSNSGDNQTIPFPVAPGMPCRKCGVPLSPGIRHACRAEATS